MVFFDDSPAFRLQPDAALKGVKPVAWYRQRRRRCAAAGRGASSISTRRSRSSRRRSARATSCCSATKSPGAPAARHVQAAVQRHLLRQRARRRGPARARPNSRNGERVCALRAVCGANRTRARCAPGRSAISRTKPSMPPGSVLAPSGRMASPTLNVERLWSMADGTVCLLVEREDAPRFEICVVRGEEVLRQNRLYARGSAQMLAETWRSNLSSASDRRALGGLRSDRYGCGTSSGDGMKLYRCRPTISWITTSGCSCVDDRRRRSRSATDRPRG